MINVYGLGWINGEGYGCLKKSIRVDLDSSGGNGPILPGKKEIFLQPFENFGRLDTISKMTCYAVGLALKDTGLSYPLNTERDIGIIGTNGAGSLQSDIRYYKDYLENGRTLGRGNFFIYTLPSSPLSEASIYFGLRGPLFYMAGSESVSAELLASAAEIICLGEASMMLVGSAEEDGAFFFTLAAEDSDFADDRLCDMAEIKSIAATFNL